MNTTKQSGTFISYSRKDKEFALEFARELKSAGCLVWLDQLDIPTGGRWDDEVEMALHECEIFLIILTPASVSSENVKDEIGYAIDHGKRIMPVLLEECAVPLRLSRFQYVDFTKTEFSEGVRRAKQLLDALLNERSTPVLTINPVLEPQKAPNRKATPTLSSPNKNKPVQRRWVGVGAGILALATCLGVLGATIILKDLFFPPTALPPTSALPITNVPTAVPPTTIQPTVVPPTIIVPVPTSFTPSQSDSPDAIKFAVNSLDVASGNLYSYFTGILIVGATVYSDRVYVYSTIPSFLDGKTYIATPNADLFSTGSNFLIFNINREAIVYVAHDDRYINKPYWLNSFQDTGADLEYLWTGGVIKLSLYGKQFSKGQVVLGGNISSEEKANYGMYTVVIAEK